MYALLFYKDGKPKTIVPYESIAEVEIAKFEYRMQQLYGDVYIPIGDNQLDEEYTRAINCDMGLYNNRIVRVTWEQY